MPFTLTPKLKELTPSAISDGIDIIISLGIKNSNTGSPVDNITAANIIVKARDGINLLHGNKYTPYIEPYKVSILVPPVLGVYLIKVTAEVFQHGIVWGPAIMVTYPITLVINVKRGVNEGTESFDYSPPPIAVPKITAMTRFRKSRVSIFRRSGLI